MKVLVTGSNGLTGYSLKKISQNSNYDFIWIDRSCGDLRRQDFILELFQNYKPDYVINAAARVYGISGNLKFPFDLAYDNFLINLNIIKACLEFSVKKLISFSSVCAYPSNLQEVSEKDMHCGPLFEANEFYGFSKRSVDILIRAAEKQYGITNYTTVCPTNIFGPNDLYSIEYGHIIPALIHKLYRAKFLGDQFTVFGDGQSLREFLFIDDLSKVILALLDLDFPNRLIVGNDEEVSIQKVVELLINISDYDGNVVWQKDKPNGQRTRKTNKNKFKEMFPNFQFTPLDEALTITWEWFVRNYPNVRTEYGN